MALDKQSEADSLRRVAGAQSKAKIVLFFATLAYFGPLRETSSSRSISAYVLGYATASPAMPGACHMVDAEFFCTLLALFQHFLLDKTGEAC